MTNESNQIGDLMEKNIKYLQWTKEKYYHSDNAISNRECK
jgi:hypothetical protein